MIHTHTHTHTHTYTHTNMVAQVMLAASAAEILGTTCLLPFESIRIRMVSDPTFAKGVCVCV
jgi:hypothetical protein